MSKSSRSSRVLVILVGLLTISALLVNTYALDLSGPWGSSQSVVALSSPSEPMSPMTIGTCDTAGPIEVESSGGTTTPTAYATLKAAFDAILAGTHTGTINVEVCGNTTETATANLDASGVGAASYTGITVRPVGAGRIIEGSIVGAIIKLNGADNVTIDGRQGGTGSARDLTVRNSNTSTATAAIWLASVAAGNGVTNNTIRNLELAGGATQNTSTNSTFGIIMCGTTISTTANGVDNDNNSFIANRIIRARYGIVTRGTTTDLNASPVVTDNIVGPTAFGADEIGKVGILMQADTGALVSRNTVQFVGGDFANTTGGADRVGIGIGSESWSMSPGTLTSNTYTVTRNVIHDVVEERTFSALGINLGTTGGGSATNNIVANNFVYNVKANSTSGDQPVGIGIAGGLGDKVVFNSVSMVGDVDPNAGATATTNFGSGIRVGNNTGSTHGNLTLSSNSVYMDLSSSSTATVRFYAISGAINTFNWGTGSENYNNLYINALNPQTQTGGLGTVSGNTLTTQFATLANWQTAYTTPAAQDANSIQTDPLHVSTTADLHIAVGSPNVNAGNAVSGVTRDIDNQLRVAAFDIGADEPSGIAPAANDIEATAILVPANGSTFPTGTTTTPQARFTNVGSATVTSRQVTFTITGPGGYSYSNNQTIASIDPDQSVTVTFAVTPAFATAGAYTMTAATAADSNTSNDSIGGSFSAVAPFTGSYNVGTAETFTSLTNPGGIFAAINAAGATGNVTINITSDLTAETGTVALNEIAGGFTVLIKPTGSARTISGTTGGASVGLLGFNSTDGVTIDGSLSGGSDRSLTINNTIATNSGGGIYFGSGVNGAQNNTVKNVNVWGGGTLTGTLLGIAIGSSTFGAVGIDNDNNRIENCDVRGTYYGIASLGASAANKDTGLVVSRNVMPATGTAGIGRVGIYIIFADGAQITQNNIASVSNPGSVDTIGIAAGSQALSNTPLTTGGISNSTIARNYVGVVSNNATFSAAGIVVASDTVGTNNVVNNMVTGVIGNSNAGDIVAGIYVNGLAGSTQNIYHNSVSMSGDRGSATANLLPSYALAIATDQPTNVVNNALSNSQTKTGATGGGGESYAIGFDGPAANVNLLSNYNDLFVSGPIGIVGITGDLITAAQTTTAGTGTNQATLAAWQTAATEDANSISADPLFTSATDLHILGASPLANIGTSVSVTVDYDGDTRPSGAAPEIGADEVDQAAPDTTILTNPTNPSSSATGAFTFSGTDQLAPEAVVGFQCKVDAGAFTACTSPFTTTPLSDGSHTFEVRAVDGGGNVDPSPATYTWTVDTTPPDTQILTNPTDPTTNTTATFTFGGTDVAAPDAVASFACKLDGGAFAVCTSPQSYMGLATGSHTFQVRAIDTAGNVDGSPASFTWTINPASVGPVAVTATTGTPGPTDYPTLKAAFDAINAGTHTGVVTASILANTTETATAVLNASGSGAASYTSLLIQPSGGAARTVSGSIVGHLVDLNGADNVTINGLNTGGNSLTFSNAAIGAASTIRFANDASNNTVTNMNLLGSGDASFGVVYFGAGTTTGNDGNTVSNSNIGPAGSNLPLNGVFSLGTSAVIDNSGNTISGNNISDFFSAASASNGVNINSFNSTWTISNNKIFQTATRTYTTASTHNGISVTSGSGYTITGNTIGFAAANGTGVYTMTGAVATRFVGINLAVGTAADTSVQGNTVASIAMTGIGTNSANGTLCGVNITSGNVNVGNVTPNTFGSTTGTGSLSATPTTTVGAAVIGINSSTTGTVVISNNTFGSFSSFSATAANPGSAFGVNVSGAAASMTITGNTIGNATAENIIAGVLGTTTASSIAGGIIQSAAPAISNYSNNTIRNISSYGTGTGGYVRGIQTGTTSSATAVATINGNTISNLITSGATSGQSSAVTSAQGIQFLPGINSTIAGNTISNISNVNAGAVGTVVCGISHGSATNTVIANNVIFGLSNASTTTSTTLPNVISGIVLRSGTTTTTVQNNMISLGTGQTTNSSIYGIWGNHGSTPDPADKIYYNTVNIEGTAASGAAPSAAFHRGDLTATAKFPAVDLRNNILVNTRSGGTGKHYAIANHIGAAASVATGWAANNNVLNANAATIGFWTTDQTFAGWKGASGGDGLSYSGIGVTFVNNASNLHLNMGVTPTSIESGGVAIAGITTDIDGQVRPGPTGSTNGGAFAPDIGADEFDGVYSDAAAPVITYTALTNTAVTTNRTLSINVTDNTGVASGANLPRVYFRKATDAAYASTACSLTSGTPQNGNYDCLINYALVGGGSTAAFDTIQYFVVAQDTIGNLSSNPSAGFTGTNVNTVTTPPTSPSYYLITGVFNGTYTVGTGGAFTSLTNPGGIFDHINNTTVSGNVTINIVSDLTGENGGIALNQTTETGAGGYTITIKPTGAPRSITGASAAGIIRLNDADRVTIDGSTAGGTATGVGGNASLRNLTIQNTSTTATAGSVILIGSTANGAQNNTIKNVSVSGQDPTQTLIGIDVGGITPGSAGADNDNVRVENCSVQKAFIGIYNAGASAANQNTGNVFTMNDLSATGTSRLRRAGMLFFNHDGLQVTLNSVGGISSDEGIDAYGIGLGIQAYDTTTVSSGAITNSVISRNRINGVASTSTTGFTAVGIGIAGGTTGANVISNNMVTGVMAPSTSPDLTAGIYVAGVTGASTKLFYNSVSMTGDRGVVASQIGSFGLAVTGVDPVLELKDNVFYTTQTSGGGATAKSYSIGMVTTTFVNLDSNYNDFVSTGANAGGFRTGGLGATATDLATLALWQAAVTDDANSTAADPVFVDPLTDLHLQSTSTLINTGIAAGGITVDFDGQTRDATPDIGADEFVILVPGSLQFSSATYAVGEAGPTATITVTRTGGSDGIVGASYATVAGGTATGGATCGGAVDYQNTSGTVSFGNGVTTPQTFTVAICDDVLLEGSETVDLALTSPTGGATLGTPNTAVLTITDNEVAVPGSLQFSAATYSVGEAGPTATITVTRTGGSDGVVGATYATNIGGTASSGVSCGGAVDYVTTVGTVVFGNGVTTPQTFTIPICDDATVEGNETVNLGLTNTTGGATLGTPNTAVLTIIDNDTAAGAYSINDVRVTEGNSGPVNAVFTVTYTAGGASAVNFGTANRTATAGTDYTTNSGTLNFPASGSTQTQTVTVVVSGDTTKEANETFYVNLTGATGGATISDNQGVGIIVDEDRPYVTDFDRDLKADFSVARGSENRWYVLPSGTGVPSVVTFGTVGDRPTPGDYDGDGKTDMSFYRPSTSTWFILNSSTSTTTTWVVGSAGDKPVQGDYNGDGKSDIATFSPSSGTWSIFNIADGTSTFQTFGISTDRPVQGDYDGDAKTDLAVYRDGTWYILQSSNASVSIQNWGNSTDKPVSGDFNGDGQFDLAVYRNGQWWVLNSLTGASSVVAWGLATDIPTPADYDGDGTTDVAIFRPSDGDWYVLRSSTLTIQGIHWGLNGDFPIPAGRLPQ